MTNFDTDLKDGEALSVLLTQLNPSMCPPCNEPPGFVVFAKHIIANAKVSIPPPPSVEASVGSLSEKGFRFSLPWGGQVIFIGVFSAVGYASISVRPVVT